MKIIIFNILVLFEIFKMSIIMVNLLNYELTIVKKKYVVLIIFIELFFLVMLLFGDVNIVNNSIILLIITLLGIIHLFNENIIQIIIVFIPIYISISCIDLFCAKIIAIIKTDSVIKINDYIWRLVYNMFGLVIICLFLVIFRRYIIKRSTRLRIDMSIILFLVIFCNMFALGYTLLRLNNNEIFNLLFAGVCISIIISGCIIITLFDSRERFKNFASYSEKLIITQYDYYQKLQLQDENLRRFQHDYKNHILCLRTLAEKGEFEQLIYYMNKMDQTVDKCIYKFNVGNDLVNCLLTQLENKYENYGIYIITKGTFPVNIEIDNIDICIIISNSLSNAFEAAYRVNNFEEKKIYFYVKLINQILYIEITNPVDTFIDMRESNYKTTKNNSKYHGFGIRNIKECIKKYNGNLEYICTTNEMKTKIILNVNFVDIHSN